MYMHILSTASKGGGATKSKLPAAPQTGKGHKQVLKLQGTVYMYIICSLGMYMYIQFFFNSL